ncbi:helix-turn-helix transcriptional regulator [Myxococcus fulvus]|uniref:helix-turn-helix transcriptional regulator n=1 Tax=Myxococcus fulvus TaxID=33 RepID=UPI003B9B74AA
MATPDDLACELAELVRLRRARDLMDREFDSPLTVESVARVAAMSPAHFSRRFRKEYGESPYAYLMTRRIERAMALLRRGDQSVTDVCMAVGCSSLGSFSASFTRLVGMPPSDYRAKEHPEDQVLPACIQKERTRPRRAGFEKHPPTR